MVLDSKNCQILNLLQENCRISLTDIATEVGLSVDSVKKRIDKMIENKIFYPRIQLRPRNFGYKNIVNVNVKLHDFTDEDFNDFIRYLRECVNVAEIFSLSGEWDLMIVILSKDAEDLAMITNAIRNKFHKIINDWSENLTTMTYKFESYDMMKLLSDLK